MRVVATFLCALLISACGGGSTPQPAGVDPTTPSVGCDGSCADTATQLSSADVERVISQAVAEAQARNTPATIAVVGRVGNVLGVFRMNGAANTLTVQSPGAAVDGGLEGVNIVPDSLGAISKAITAAYLSTEGNAFSTRTASQIVQQHFNPLDNLQPSGPLFGVQFSQLPCSDLLSVLPQRRMSGHIGHHLAWPLIRAGLPLYKSGTPVGGVGVISDGLYSLDPDVSDTDIDDDEAIALAGTDGFGAPGERRAGRVAVDGRSLRFSDTVAADLVSDPGAAPAFATLNAVAGVLLNVPGYVAATTSGGLAYGQAESGIRPDTLDYPGLDAFVLVDTANTERFRPIAGTDGASALTANEVQGILAEGLALANRMRAQIRQPLGTPGACFPVSR